MSRQREKLVELGMEDAILFTSPDFDSAIIGTTTDGRVVYSYDLMVDKLVREDGIDEEEAIEFIDYNTIRSLQYIDGKYPVVVQNQFEFLEI
jgi:hypothetical protein